jgi:hypothetical protein
LCGLIGRPIGQSFTPRCCGDGAGWEIILLFNVAEMGIDAGVELALAGNELQDDGVGARVDAGFWVDTSKK